MRHLLLTNTKPGTILCGTFKMGHTKTTKPNDPKRPVTCEACRVKMREEGKLPPNTVDTQSLTHRTYTMNEPMVNIAPDWEATWTAARAEHELHNFKFKGLGWYVTKRKTGEECDTLLVLPYGNLEETADFLCPERALEGKDTEKSKLYKFYVYNARNPAETFNWLVNAPTRVDERSQ